MPEKAWSFEFGSWSLFEICHLIFVIFFAAKKEQNC
jgi:hypothetical protein